MALEQPNARDYCLLAPDRRSGGVTLHQLLQPTTQHHVSIEGISDSKKLWIYLLSVTTLDEGAHFQDTLHSSLSITGLVGSYDVRVTGNTTVTDSLPINAESIIVGSSNCFAAGDQRKLFASSNLGTLTQAVTPAELKGSNEVAITNGGHLSENRITLALTNTGEFTLICQATVCSASNKSTDSATVILSPLSTGFAASRPALRQRTNSSVTLWSPSARIKDTVEVTINAGDSNLIRPVSKFSCRCGQSPVINLFGVAEGDTAGFAKEGD